MLIAKQMRAHLLARIVGRDVTDAIGEMPEPATWTPPTTDKGWRELVHYLIDRITVDGGNDGAHMEFEGVKWIYDDLDGPAANVPTIVNTTASRR
jgi:hypothetical protein